MKRRNFLRTAGLLGAPTLLQPKLFADPFTLFSQLANVDNDKILVLIHLAGGNDGLNTVIGLDQLHNLRQVRGNVALSDDDITNITDEVGLNRVMTGMKNLFTDGRLGIIRAVGYPNQNRSHFRSSDIWMTASGASEIITTGWLGRYLALDHPEYPEGYPNDSSPHPLAMTMGRVPSPTCQGVLYNFSQATRNPHNFTYIVPGGDTPLPDNKFGDQVEFVRSVIGQNNEYGEVVQRAAEMGQSQSDNYPNSALGTQLKNIATLIDGGLQTKVFKVTMKGFDTHGNQISRQRSLLADLGDSIAAFMEDLEAIGAADRVLGMTISEFGRTVRPTADGTNHGAAGPLFLFGNCVQGGITGENPVITPEDESSLRGVAMQYDFRDVYGSILVDWFDVPTATVQNLFSSGFTYLPIIGSCGQELPVDLLSLVATGHDKHIEVRWQTDNEINNRGFAVERSRDGREFSQIGWVPAAPAGSSSVRDYAFHDRDVLVGRTYYYQLRQEDLDGTGTFSPIKMARLRGTATADWEVGLPQANPINADSFVQVYSPSDAVVTYEVMDHQGRRLRTGRATLAGGQDNRLPLPPATLPPGVYVWRLRTPSGRALVRKFVVQ